MNVELRTAAASDLESVRQLLREAALPTDGVEDQFPSQYAVAVAGDAIVGVAGLELHGDVALLRSLAVRPAFRGEGLGSRLVNDRTERARGLGVGQVFLLTTTAAKYFEGLGFRPTLRDGAPQALASSKEFAFACPETAACLVWQA